MRSIRNEVVRPDVIRTFWPKPDAGAIGQPKSGSFRLFLRHLKTLFAPDRIDTIVTNGPSLEIKEPRDLAVAISAILLGDLDDSCSEAILIRFLSTDVPLGASYLSQYFAGPALRDVKPRPCGLHTVSPTCRA